MTISPRIGINPLPWILDPRTGFHLDVPSLQAAFRVLAPLGFRAVQADVPADLDIAQYRRLLDEFGLRCAPGYFSAAFDDPDAAPTIRERALRHADVQLALGLTETFIAGAPAPARREVPAVGHDFDHVRLDRFIDTLGVTAEAMAAEGLACALHPHVGTWIETEFETRAALDAIPAATLAFGPDTGHLQWAGADPASLIGDYKDRVVAMHLKDVDPQAVIRARAAEHAYAVAATEDHVWTEPGRGDVDFAAAFASLPDGFDGWIMIEVDVPNIGSAADSAAECARWLSGQESLSASWHLSASGQPDSF